MSEFSKKVHTIVKGIAQGQVMTYQEVAIAAGNAKAARAVANLMAKNYDPSIPCHRVIRTDGTLGGYNRGGVEAKRALLIKEGYTFSNN
jgi:methylated-DNA-[protein]-cysteine S-methyltransferase